MKRKVREMQEEAERIEKMQRQAEEAAGSFSFSFLFFFFFSPFFLLSCSLFDSHSMMHHFLSNLILSFVLQDQEQKKLIPKKIFRSSFESKF